MLPPRCTVLVGDEDRLVEVLLLDSFFAIALSRSSRAESRLIFVGVEGVDVGAVDTIRI